MRYLIILLITISLGANDIKRVEYIVEDIENLKKDYRQCIDLLNLANEENGCSETKLLKKLQNENKNQKKLLRKREKEIISLNKKYKRLLAKSKVKPYLPTLLNEKSNTKFSKVSDNKNGIYKFKASAFRLISDAKIYNKPNGLLLDVWEKNRSFTSGERTKNWIKITGYFVDKIWRKSKEDYWVRDNKVIQR